MLFAAVAIRPAKVEAVPEEEEEKEEENVVGGEGQKGAIVERKREVVKEVARRVEVVVEEASSDAGRRTVVEGERRLVRGKDEKDEKDDIDKQQNDDDDDDDDDFESDDFEDDDSDEVTGVAGGATTGTITGTITGTTTSTDYVPPAPTRVPVTIVASTPTRSPPATASTTTTTTTTTTTASAALPSDSDDSSHEDVLRRYRLSVDLRSIRDVASPSTVYLAYTLPTFGASSAVRTRPPIALTKNSESLLPHGYQMFEVCLTRSQLQSALATPLSVDVVRKDKYQTDAPMGTATIPITGLLESKRFYRDARTRKTFSSFAMLRSFQKSGGSGSSGGGGSGGGGSSNGSGGGVGKKSKYVTVRTEDRYVQVLQSKEEGRIVKMASLRIVVILEDMGVARGQLAKASNVAVQASTKLGARTSRGGSDGSGGSGQGGFAERIESAASLGRATSAAMRTPIRGGGSGGGQMSSSSSSSSSSYDPAEDPKNQDALAEWVSSEYERWESGMRRKEEERMNELEEAWCHREEERVASIASMTKSYTNVETQLRQKLDVVENRERALHLKELEMNRRQEVQAGELRIQQRRLEEELQHKISIEKRKSEELTSRVKSLVKGRDAAESRARRVESDFAQYRQDQRSTPEAVLHARVSELTTKVTELRMSNEMEKQKSEVERAAKMECQAQLGRLVRELQAVRREQRMVQERNMESLRLQYVAREERYVLDGDQQELRSIKNELDELRRAAVQESGGGSSGGSGGGGVGGLSFGGRAPTPSRAAAVASASPAASTTNAFVTLQRLEKERRDLLDTGAYDCEHPIVKSLDTRIRQTAQSSGGGMRDGSA